MKKPLTILFLLFTGLLVPVSPVSGVAGFGDVEADRFYTKPVQWMIDEQIINTGHSSCFAPDIAATRGDTALYMWRMQQQPGAPVSRQALSVVATEHSVDVLCGVPVVEFAGHVVEGVLDEREVYGVYVEVGAFG